MELSKRIAVGGGGNSEKSSVAKVLRALGFELLRKICHTERQRSIYANGINHAILRCTQNDITSCPPLAGGGFADGRSKTSPDSEQIEYTVARQHVRNSESVEQIQDRPKSLISRWGKTIGHAERSEFENRHSAKASTQRGEFTPSLIREGRDGYYSCSPLTKYLYLLPILGKRFQSVGEKTEQLAPTSILPHKGGATHVAHSDNSRKVAFTLAEVLITLGIIGVVAAITIPSLIQSYKEQVTVAKVQKAYSVLNQAFKSISAEYGEPKDWPGVEYDGNACASCSTAHRDLYAQYIVGCKKFDGQIYGTVDTSKKIKTLNGELYTYLYYFPSFTNSEGIVFQFSSFRNCGGYFLSTGNLTACGMGGDILIDINGYDKGPNQLGKDFFAFTTAKTGIYPAGMVGSYTAGDCNLKGRGVSCTEYILREKSLKYLNK